jgi:hypothetical protein
MLSPFFGLRDSDFKHRGRELISRPNNIPNADKFQTHVTGHVFDPRGDCPLQGRALVLALQFPERFAAQIRADRIREAIEAKAHSWDAAQGELATEREAMRLKGPQSP